MRRHSWCSSNAWELSVLLMALVACGGAEVDAEGDSSGAEPEALGHVEQALSGTTVPAFNQVLTCEDPNFGGFCDLVGVGNHAQSVGVGNDRLSSFKVGSGVRVTFCANPTFASTCKTYGPGLLVTQITAPPNDTASSMRVELTTVPSCRSGLPPQGFAYLFRGPNFDSDDCVTLGIGNYANSTVHGLQNDTLTSLMVGPNTSVSVYKDPNFVLPRTIYTGGAAALQVTQVTNNDTMSSVAVDPL